MRDVVVLRADELRGEDPRGRGERVHGRVDALVGDRPLQVGGRVEVGERGGRGRVGVVVRRHVDRLHRGDRLAADGGDPLLQLAHLVGQRRLVTHRGRHPAEQRGDLGAGLGEAEDVVDEEQHLLLLHVAEVLRHGQRGQRDPQPGARRLVHLAEDQRGLLDDAGLGHLQDEVVALAGALTDAGEDRGTTEVAGDPDDHLLDEHRLAHAGAAEQADLAALDVRGEQVEDLDAGLQHLGLRLQVGEGRRLAVDRPPVALISSVSGRRGSSPIALNTWPLTASPTGTGSARRCRAPRRRGPGRRSAASRWRGPCCRPGAARPPGSASCSPASGESPRSTSTFSALKISGIASRGNSASTTGPMTRTTRPVAMVSWDSRTAVITFTPRRGERVRAADDLTDLLGDRRPGGPSSSRACRS